ncbi:hypothetical protein SAVIM40S_05463 [Streptomyces avidinii]
MRRARHVAQSGVQVPARRARLRARVGAVAAHVGQSVRRGRLRHVAEQAGEVALVLRQGFAASGLGDEVAEGQRRGQRGLRGRSRWSAPRRGALPARCGRAPCGAVAPGRAAGRCRGAVRCAPRSAGAPAEVHGEPTSATRSAAGSVGPPGRGPPRSTGRTALAPDDLDRLAQSLPDERGPVDVVPVDHLLERLERRPSSRSVVSNSMRRAARRRPRRRRRGGGGRAGPPGGGPGDRRPRRSRRRRRRSRRSGRPRRRSGRRAAASPA